MPSPAASASWAKRSHSDLARTGDPFGLKQPVPISVSKDGLINLLPAVDELVSKMKGDLMGLDRIVASWWKAPSPSTARWCSCTPCFPKKGDTIDFKTINADVKTVFELGYFDDVKALLRDASGGKILVVRVVEKPASWPSASRAPRSSRARTSSSPPIPRKARC